MYTLKHYYLNFKKMNVNIQNYFQYFTVTCRTCPFGFSTSSSTNLILYSKLKLLRAGGVDQGVEHCLASVKP
jgi:hypothetical protein